MTQCETCLDKDKSKCQCVREEQGLVRCDYKCPAKQSPETPEEIKFAYFHWKDHRSMRGCSHGN